MWFLNGRPSEINITALVASLENGYQETIIRFMVAADPAATVDSRGMWLGFPFPWASHKPNGSFKFLTAGAPNLLALIEENSGRTQRMELIDETNSVIYEKPRALKTLPDIELIHVQELMNWHVEDFGIVTFWAQPGVWHEIHYTHKIDPDSCLFFPTRLPTVIGSRKMPKSCKIWIVDGLTTDLEKHCCRVPFNPKLRELLKESQSTLDCIECPPVGDKIAQLGLPAGVEYQWDNDTRIHSYGWESSDDQEYVSDDEDE